MEKDLNKLRDRAYRCACEHGFHDKEYSDAHFLMLVITEISEAVEADRKGKVANINDFLLINKRSINRTKNENYLNGIAFESCIKESIEDELSDVVIRLLDFAGLKKVQLDRIILAYVVSPKKSFTENMYAIVKDIVNYKYSTEELINYAIHQVIRVAGFYKIDIFQHIEWKMKYNELRPMLNGKRY